MEKRLGDYFRETRNKEEKSLGQFSEALGMSKVHMSKIERFEVCPNYDLITTLAKKFNFNLSDLLSQLKFEKKRYFTKIQNFDVLYNKNNEISSNDKTKHIVIEEFLRTLENKEHA